MYEDLSRLLEGRVDPVYWTALCALVAALEKHEAVLWKDQITHLVTNGDNLDYAVLTDQAVAILYAQVEVLVQQMRITLDLSNLRPAMLADMLEALAFRPSDLDAELLAAVQAADDSVEAICNIFGVKLNQAPEYFMEYVLAVSDLTIQQIVTVLQRQVEQAEYSEYDVRAILGQLNKHQALVPGNVTAAMESLGAGVPVGTQMQVLVDTHNDRLTGGNIEGSVDDLISLAVMANTNMEALHDEVGFFLDQLYPEIFERQKAEKHLNKRLEALKGF